MIDTTAHRLRRNRAKMLVTFSSILLSALILEGGLQIYYRLTQQSWLWAFNAFHVTFVDEVADRRKYALRRGFADQSIGVSINDSGLRAPPGIGVEQSAPVIALMGDSKAFGSGVRDDETYPYFLDRHFVNNGSVFRTINAGVPSYNTRQVLDRFRLDILPHYNVKIVVLHAAFNDISLLTHYRERWDADKTWADIRYQGFRPPLTGVRKSAIIFYANRLISRKPDESPANRSGGVDYSSFPNTAMMANLRNEIESFLGLCQSPQLPVVLMPIDPFYYQTAHEEKNNSLPLWAANHHYFDVWKPMVQDYDDLLIDLSRGHDSVYFFDTRKFLDTQDRGGLYVDAVHYSAKGNRVVASGLYDFLKSEGLVDQ